MMRTLKKLISPRNPLRLAYHAARAWACALLFGFPARSMIVIGVTGTDGKTTTCTMLHSILSAAGITAGMFTTVETRIGTVSRKNLTHRTTLESFQLQRALHDMKKKGCSHVVIETTSHALSQKRIAGIPYDVSVLTNITHEHLDYHGTMKNYRDDKAKLFMNLIRSGKKGIPKTAILNMDDNSYSFFRNMPAERIITYGRTVNADVQIMHDEPLENGIRFTMVTHEGSIPVRLKIPGAFNVENATAAAAAAMALNIPSSKIREGLENITLIPGRMEQVDSGQNFRVYIDFAMTANGYEKALKSLKAITQGQLWLVFGCCGDRDRAKRPVIGEIAGRLADKIVITDDEPYFENPEAIRNMIESGIKKTAKKKNVDYFVIEGRKNGLQFAIKHANAGDCILVPGMGDFEGLTIRDKTLTWSDRKVILELLEKRTSVRGDR